MSQTLALDFDIDVVLPRQHRRELLGVALCTALTAGAFAWTDPPGGDRSAPAFAPHRRVAVVAPAPVAPGPVVASALAPTSNVDSAVAPAAAPSTEAPPAAARAIPVQHRARLRPAEARVLVQRSDLARALDGIVHPGPFVPEKAAVHVSAPRGEVIDAVLDDKGIDLVMHASADAFRACYESEAKTNPTLRTTLAAKFTVDAGGAVRSARVVAPDEDARGLARCVHHALLRATFPPTGAGTLSVSRKLTFRPDLAEHAHS